MYYRCFSKFRALTAFDKELLIDMYVELFKRFKECVDGYSKEN